MLPASPEPADEESAAAGVSLWPVAGSPLESEARLAGCGATVAAFAPCVPLVEGPAIWTSVGSGAAVVVVGSAVLTVVAGSAGAAVTSDAPAAVSAALVVGAAAVASVALAAGAAAVAVVPAAAALVAAVPAAASLALAGALPALEVSVATSSCAMA